MKNAIVMLALAASLAGAQPISISKTGQGPPLVFIPGLGCRAEVWRAAVEQLSKRHLCVLVSIAGFGGLPADGPPDFEHVKSAIVEAAAREKWRSPVLIGHSFGGFLALSLAASHPDPSPDSFRQQQTLLLQMSGSGDAQAKTPVLGLGTWAGRERLGFTREKVEQWLKEQYRALPRSSIAVSDRARHFVMLDDPAWLVDQIAGFSGQ